MVDFNDQEFFDLEPASQASAPSWRKPKMLAAIGGAIVGVVLLGGIGVYAWSLLSSGGNQLPQGTERTAEELAAQMMESCADDDASCVNQANANAAREVGDITACAEVTGVAYDECLSVIAFDQGDATLCERVSNDRRTACADNAWIKAASSQKKYALCANITDNDRRTACEENVGVQAASANNCAGFGAPESYCSQKLAVEAVLIAGDPAGCLSLSVEGRIECQELFPVRDDDSDGLTKEQEFELGTSDQMADTDGDGYNDGEEVAGGYNPLAP
ncbi:hypothetical protein KBC55_00790 [Patescibacteria group bacterium]|nr:hypothetical protein [Patescibacteria group bacterium]